MKKLAILSCLFVLTVWVAVLASQKETHAGMPAGFTQISEDYVNGIDVSVIRHKKSGCYYVMTSHYKGGTSITQMMVTKLGEITIPYCKKQ